MKMYSTTHPSTLVGDARIRLLREGYRHDELPIVWFSDYKYVERPFQIERETRVKRYWSTDFAMTGGGTVYSPYQTAHHEVAGMGEHAATFDQWGIMLGAMFDVERDREPQPYDEALLKIGGRYDWNAKHAVLQPRGPEKGLRFLSSFELFSYLTCGEYSRARRADAGVSLACRVHRWGRTDGSGITRCSKCDRPHRFAHLMTWTNPDAAQFSLARCL